MSGLFVKNPFIAILLTIILNSFVLSAHNNELECQPDVVAQLMEVEQIGILKFKDDGYLYLDVSDEFISKAMAIIEVSGKLIPTRHYTEKNGIGAHISVIYGNEQPVCDCADIIEVGQPYVFAVRALRSLKLKRDNFKTKLWMIDVEAPELSLIREKYGLEPLFKGHNFHITLGAELLEEVDCDTCEIDAA
jgi:hypothetical protein